MSLAHHERLRITRAVGVGPARGAGAGRGARHRVDGGAGAYVQGAKAGYLDRPAPHAVPLAHHERLAAGGVDVETARGAVARRRARHGADAGAAARVQGTQAGDLDRPAPHAVPLAHHERLVTTKAVSVES